MFPQRFSPEQCSGERPAGTGVSLSLGLDRQIQARAARIGGPAGAGVSLSLGLDRQIQARPARVGGFEEIRGATHWAEMGRFWWWPPDLAIRRERVPLPWLGLDRQIQARPARVGGFEEIRGRAMIRRGPWRRHLGEPADKAGVGRGLTMAVNVSAAHEDVTSLSGKPPPGRGAGGKACRGMATRGSARQSGPPV